MTPYEIRVFFWNLIFIVQNLLPVVGLLIIVLEVKIRKEFLNFIKIIVPVSGIFYFLVGQTGIPIFPCHNLYLFYSLIIPLFLHFLQFRNPDNPTNVLGVFLMVSHLFSQYWEIPVFIAGHLNVLGAEYLGSIDQIYLILVLYLAIKYANISIDKETILYLSVPLIFSAIALYILPIGKPQMPLGYLVRGLSCFCLGKVFVDRSIL